MPYSILNPSPRYSTASTLANGNPLRWCVGSNFQRHCIALHNISHPEPASPITQLNQAYSTLL